MRLLFIWVSLLYVVVFILCKVSVEISSSLKKYIKRVEIFPNNLVGLGSFFTFVLCCLIFIIWIKLYLAL